MSSAGGVLNPLPSSTTWWERAGSFGRAMPGAGRNGRRRLGQVVGEGGRICEFGGGIPTDIRSSFSRGEWHKKGCREGEVSKSGSDQES